MIYLFSHKGIEVLCSFVDATTLFAFDLDGTLAPIVDEPAAITINDEVRQSLIQLNNLAPVTIITGRSRSDAMSHLGFAPRFLVGNHGAEGLPGETTSAQDFTKICKGWINQLELLLPDMSTNGILLETKGQTIALHYRQAPDPVSAQNIILAAFADLIPLPRVVSGIFVENIAPQNAPHKGAALESLMAHMKCTRAIFVGDDVTDEDVFALHNPSILGIRVGNDPKSAALSYLKDQHEMVRLLREIISLLNASTRTKENLKN